MSWLLRMISKRTSGKNDKISFGENKKKCEWIVIQIKINFWGLNFIFLQEIFSVNIVLKCKFLFIRSARIWEDAKIPHAKRHKNYSDNLDFWFKPLFITSTKNWLFFLTCSQKRKIKSRKLFNKTKIPKQEKISE